jgi:hypothetical protein
MFKNPIVLAVFFFGLIGILILTKQVETPKIFLPKANVVGVTLSLVPTIVNLEPGQTTVLDLSLDSDSEEVTAIELYLDYDTTKIEVTDIASTEILPQILAKELKSTEGSNAILLSSPGSDPVKNGVAGRIHIKALEAGKTTLKIGNNTKVSAVGKSGDVLGAVESSEVTIAGAAAPAKAIPNDLPATTEKANQLIKDFITQEASPEGETPEGGNILTRSTSVVSNYIKGLISDINTNLENQAEKLFE